MLSIALNSIGKVINNWYLLLIAGILLAGMGIVVMATPLTSYVALAFMFSLLCLLSGCLQMVFAIQTRSALKNWGWNLAAGILYTLIGILLLWRNDISMATLPFVMGFYGLMVSANCLGWAFELKNLGILQWGNVAIASILGMLFSFLLLANPLFAGITLVTWTSLALLFSGVAIIVLSLRIRKLKQLPQKVSASLQNKLEFLDQEYQQAIRTNTV